MLMLEVVNAGGRKYRNYFFCNKLVKFKKSKLIFKTICKFSKTNISICFQNVKNSFSFCFEKCKKTKWKHFQSCSICSKLGGEKIQNVCIIFWKQFSMSLLAQLYLGNWDLLHCKFVLINSSVRCLRLLWFVW